MMVSITDRSERIVVFAIFGLAGWSDPVLDAE